jgi:predicted nucleotidyltransferase
MASPRIDIPRDRIAAFCRKWRVRRFALFGSVLTDSFRPDSDIDVLVKFEPDHPWSLLDHVRMQEELAGIFGRPVDLVSQAGLERSENHLRKREILETAHPIYEAA